MTETNRPLKVFLCHASQDKPAVRELSRRLFAEGWIDPWLDEKKLLPGQDWRLKIEEAVETSDIVIICLSSNSVTKEGFVQKELRYAREIALEKLEESIFLIPLRLDDCTVPRGLRFYQWGDYFGEQADETYDALLESLNLRYEQKLRLEEKERARKEQQEREIAEKLAREKAEREVAEKVAREKAEKEAKEKAERETAEKAAREQAKREAAEKTEREKAEKAAREKVEHEAAEKARREEAERKATEKAAQERAKREAAEKTKRERAARLATLTATLKESFFESFNSFKLAVPKAKPFLRTGGIIGIIFLFVWVGSWAIPSLLPLMSTANASLTPAHRPSATLTVSPQPPTKTATPKATSTITRTPAPTATLGVGSTMVSDRDGMSLVYVPAGEFTMGNNNNISFNYADERPMHKVNVASFWIDQTEVTNEMWALCIQANVCEPPHRYENYYGATEFADYPAVVGYHWDKAKTYCEWAGRRLPTEAEWEKAARGTDGSTYPWGESIDCNKANYGNCVGDATEVGKYPAGASIYGALDMAGNVWEWVSSLYKTYPYSVTDGREDLSTEDFTRVMRGGSWLDAGNTVRSDVRSWGIPPIDNTFTVGFRCARSP